MRGFSTLLRSREEKGAVFKLLKKRGFEIRSNISFSLVDQCSGKKKKYIGTLSYYS